MKFIDEAQIWVKAGDGGRGCVSFEREKFRPNGGPNGGDGGNGGSVTIQADCRLHSLLDFKYAPRHMAKNGEHGMGSQCNGRKGDSLLLKVPVGTVIYDDDTGEELADLLENGQEIVVAKGGLGGLGNMNFATATNQAPRYAQPGTPGEERNLRLSLKLLADVGLVGLPNVGKSTLISTVSAAKPKIADYPFTTLVPNLGVVKVDDEANYVMADIPGLVPGAHTGKGLGDRFLKHVERVRLLVHLVTCTEDENCDPRKDFQVINDELALFSPELAARPQILVLSKADLPWVASWERKLQTFAKKHNMQFVAISAPARKGVDKLKQVIWDKLLELSREESEE